MPVALHARRYTNVRSVLVTTLAHLANSTLICHVSLLFLERNQMSSFEDAEVLVAWLLVGLDTVVSPAVTSIFAIIPARDEEHGIPVGGPLLLLVGRPSERCMRQQKERPPEAEATKWQCKGLPCLLRFASLPRSSRLDWPQPRRTYHPSQRLATVTCHLPRANWIPKKRGPVPYSVRLRSGPPCFWCLIGTMIASNRKTTLQLGLT